ncbi:hypothetical protein HZB03_00100 [Candidatus Woesearchaeota archaeon]|nr:hypothetical protein [Candidatus Woesearchaeota archaeon]
MTETFTEFPKRPRKLGKVQYVHFGTEKKGHYLPCGDLSSTAHDKQLALGSASINEVLEQHKLFSPGDDYACTFITGDIGEMRSVKINGVTRQVLVVPQGMMRAEANSSNFEACNMKHSLSDAGKMLEVMALTMFHSGFTTPYFRGKGFGDIGNDMALNEQELSASFVAAAWDFFSLPSYQLQEKLGLKPKKVMASPLALHGHPLSLYKIASIYQSRIYDRQTLLHTERAKRYCSPGDIVYFLPNGLLSDAVCQNLAFVIKQGANAKVVFVEGSAGNYFFEGKTQKTTHAVIRSLKPEGITTVKVHTPEEFAREAEYEHCQKLSGRALTYEVIRTKVDGILALGTFKGIEQCESLLPEQGEPIHFDWKTERAVRKVQDSLWKTVYGIKGGTELTQDPHYCTMFDVADLEMGVVKAIDLHGTTLEDVLEK